MRPPRRCSGPPPFAGARRARRRGRRCRTGPDRRAARRHPPRAAARSKRPKQTLKETATFPERTPALRCSAGSERRACGTTPHGQADVVRHVVPDQREVQRAHGDRRGDGLRGRAAQPRGLRHPHPQPPPPAAPPAPAPRLAAAAARHALLGRRPRLRRPQPRAPRDPAGARHRRPVPRCRRRGTSRRRSTARARSGSWSWSRASRTTASRSSTRPTTRWPTASRRSTSACCSSTSSPMREPIRRRAALEPADARRRALTLVGPCDQRLLRRRSRRMLRWLGQAARQPRRAAEARLRRPRRPLGGDLEPAQAGAEGAAQRRDRAAPQLLLDAASRSTTSN